MLKVFEEFDELVLVITLLCILIQTHTYFILQSLLISAYTLSWAAIQEQILQILGLTATRKEGNRVYD